MKNKINLISKHFNTFDTFLSIFFVSFFIPKISFSDKDNNLTITFMTMDIIVEYKIFGI